VLNWNDEIKLTESERQRMRKLATSRLDLVLAQLSRTRAMLEAISAGGPERNALLARVRDAQVRVTALRQERLANLAERVPESPRIVVVRLGALKKYLDFCNDYLVVRRKGRPVRFEDHGVSTQPDSPDVSPDPMTPCPNWSWRMLIRRGGEFVKYLGRRNQAAVRTRCSSAGVAHPPQRVLTRSMASRSRVVAPIGAPPSIS
jgi:hypothetical protein